MAKRKECELRLRCICFYWKNDSSFCNSCEYCHQYWDSGIQALLKQSTFFFNNIVLVVSALISALISLKLLFIISFSPVTGNVLNVQVFVDAHSVLLPSSNNVSKNVRAFTTKNDNCFFILLISIRSKETHTGIRSSAIFRHNTKPEPDTFRNYRRVHVWHLHSSLVSLDVLERMCKCILLCAWEVNMKHLRSIAAVVHTQVTHQAHGYWVQHILDVGKLAGCVTSLAVDKTKIKPHQPVRNLPSGSLYTVIAIRQMGKCTRDRTNPPHGAFSKQVWEMNSWALTPTLIP